ncbi:hypothetical protein BJ508DRAFT_80730 [Ascobolus immersus RN42]|uniref:WW domain-containing protein n=1 Tax=Ascobolus immersus RN42 TaxID=1160509 RepID=A0A3N4IBM6_ASCIM|nr:hypothetical protein BJ508DRAFT_80730 [Ascobolus immersus RN42]
MPSTPFDSNDFAPPARPPPPTVPQGWTVRWDSHYNRWFYVNLATKQSQVRKTTALQLSLAYSKECVLLIPYSGKHLQAQPFQTNLPHTLGRLHPKVPTISVLDLNHTALTLHHIP